MDIVSFVLSVQVFTVIFNILLNYYGNKILLNYDYDDPDMKEIIYKETHKGIISGIKNFFMGWIPIYSQLYMVVGIFIILNLDVKLKLFDNLSIREWGCRKLLEEHKTKEKKQCVKKSSMNLGKK